MILFYTGQIYWYWLYWNYVEVAGEDVVELDDVDVDVDAPVVEVVGRAFATAQSVAHNITENFMSAEPLRSRTSKSGFGG